ncbi:serine O-acetyltransferase [Clostridium sp.]|uniref:serine O-acetyltransferase n=1 Tax=Clostridium sp. TaxID=1506 RepID=UPI002912ECA6|nr:DapH/DapD/GlmU-related protein [Clostridium sp.]MDU7215711.1 DapH/DapD/GlmU-related protein [Clostridium sp.]
MNVFKWYKVGNFLYKKGFKRLARVITIIIRLIFGAYVPTSADIGAGTKIGYGGIGVVIHARSKIGRNCVICQCVTIGGTSKKVDVPNIGDNVFIGAGAKILGPIEIGANCVIGANAVVTTNIPSNSLVAGIPGKVIKSDIKISDYI